MNSVKRLVFFELLFFIVGTAGAYADAYHYSADGTVIGAVETYKVKQGESLIEIARDFGLGFNEIADANPDLDPFVPGTDALVMVPKSWILPDSNSPRGIVINISEMRLYYFFEEKGSRLVRTFPIGVGSEGADTPLGEFKVVAKIVKPSWYVPASIRKERPELPKVVPPGPENPLGSHALRLSLGDILIHGTHRPFGVGRRVSHGCIRLYPEDIRKLYDLAPKGTRVMIVRQPVKAGVKDERVYIEVHRNEYQKNFNYFDEAVRLLRKKGLLDDIDSEKLYEAVEKKSGVPVDISR